MLPRTLMLWQRSCSFFLPEPPPPRSSVQHEMRNGREVVESENEAKILKNGACNDRVLP